jgi:uncharacterized OB-fold protein
MTEQTPAQPLGSFIRLGPDGRPHLCGCKCTHCGAVLLETRRGCPRCAAIGTLAPIELSHRGRLFTYTIVHRSFPGIPTPFISAIVELEGGVFIKGNLVGVELRPEALAFDLPVRVEFERLQAPGKAGTEIIRHVFVPDRPAADDGRRKSP